MLQKQNIHTDCKDTNAPHKNSILLDKLPLPHQQKAHQWRFQKNTDDITRYSVKSNHNGFPTILSGIMQLNYFLGHQIHYRDNYYH